jgi:hypothetical protein
VKPRPASLREAVTRGHARVARVELWNQGSGLVGPVPFTQGSVNFSLSRDLERAGKLVVPGLEWESVFSPGKYCWVRVYVAVEGVEFDLGEFPVTATRAEVPGGRVDVTLGDWAWRRERSRVEVQGQKLLDGVTVAEMAARHLSDVMPASVPVTCTRDDTGGAMMPVTVPLQPGDDVWSAMQRAAELAGARLVMTSRSTVEVRRYNPAVPWVEHFEGVLIRGVRTVSAETGDVCNRVRVTVNGDGGPFSAVETLTGGPYAFARNGFGFATVVESVSVATATQAAADAEAARLAARRFGALKDVELEVVPMPWLEVGDPVTLLLGGSPVKTREDFIVESLVFPLTVDATMRVNARSVAGSGWL